MSIHTMRKALELAEELDSLLKEEDPTNRGSRPARDIAKGLKQAIAEEERFLYRSAMAESPSSGQCRK